MTILRGEINPARRPQPVKSETVGHVGKKLRALVLLGGTVRPTSLSTAVGRSVLDLPIAEDHTVLKQWHAQATSLASDLELERLPVRVMINRNSVRPTLATSENHVVMRIHEDEAEYRGTAGVLHDLTDHYDDDDFVLVANGAQVTLTPLTDLFSQLAATNADVSLISNRDGSPSGAMLVRCGVLRQVPEIGFVDMKEQALPKIAKSNSVVVVHQTESTSVPIRTLTDYIHALRWYHGRSTEGFTGTNAFAEAWQARFSIIEKDAKVDANARVHDSVVLGGARVEHGALLVQSVACPGARIHRKEVVTDRLVMADQHRKRRSG
jgi:NDP-sugar pyrophosphorylase family protein